MAYSVLIVDDEDLTLCTISRGLTAEGFEILTAASGEEALQSFENEKPDLVLLDIVLPGMDGVEVLRQIKAANAACIVVMMSAFYEKVIKVKADVAALLNLFSAVSIEVRW